MGLIHHFIVGHFVDILSLFGGVRGGFREVFFALSVRGRRADVLPLRE